MPTKHPISSKADPRGGFALLITITLLAFLVLLLVSLASLTRVETQVAANTQHQAKARQNALMALNIALGQLQKHTGPDQRVTATADVQPLDYTASPRPTTDPASGVDLTGDGETVIAGIDTFWRDARNRRWTGAWKNGNETSYIPADPVAFNPIPTLQSWLVSGNESANTFAPDDQVENFTTAAVLSPSAVSARFGTEDKPYRLLLGPGTVPIDPDDEQTLDRAVVAPEVEIKSSSVPGITETDTVIGHYAWWIGDEGVKARANIVDPYATETTDQATLARRQSAQRPVIEAMTTDGADGLAKLYPANDKDLLKIVTPGQLDYLAAETSFPAERTERFHDLTVSSRGVLADTKHGGLKRDLSYILGRTSLGDFQQALKNAYNGANVTGIPALSPETTPYAILPSGGAYSDILESSATWEQLWSFYNMGNSATAGGVLDGSGAAVIRLPSATQQGIIPLLMQAKVFYGLEIVGGGAVNEGTEENPIMVNRTGTIRVTTTPVVVLANPYSVPLSLKAGDRIQIRISGNDLKVKAGESSSTDGMKLEGDTSDVVTLKNHGLDKVQLVIDSLSIPPGRAQVFTADPSENTVLPTTPSSTEIRLKNTFDPTASLSRDTGKSIPSGKRYIALSGGSTFNAFASLGDITEAENQFSYIETKKPVIEGNSMSDGTFVRPFSDGTQNGGGVAFALQDGISPLPQQAQFLQVNYRSLRIASVGSNGYDGHPLQWATVLLFPGEVGQGVALHSQMSDNLLPPPDETDPNDFKTVRWGMVNTAGYPDLSTPPAGIDPTGMVSAVNLLYDIPRPEMPITSIGQLQHFNLAGFENSSATTQVSIKANGWQVNYPIGNSYPTPRVVRHGVFHTGVLGTHYDGSYMWNDILWDRFTFSSFPQTGNFDFDDADNRLVNARYTPFRNNVENDEPSEFRGLYKAAENLLVSGAFNVNSTSIEAWKAILSGLKNVPIGSESDPDNLSAPFTRILNPAGGATDAEKGLSVNAWSGFRNLEQDDINEIAREMVLQVRMRGPFLSLSEFVNRKLTEGKETRAAVSPDTLELGLRGALQAAIDKVVNQKGDITAQTPFNEETRAFSRSAQNPYYGDLEYLMPTRISGFPGYLLQGDVLSALGPGLTARSDTFTIRAYGDVTNPATGDVEGRAWCEAVVQRMPDYISPKTASGGNTPDEAASDPDNIEFGRRYQIVSFRWLSPKDI